MKENSCYYKRTQAKLYLYGSLAPENCFHSRKRSVSLSIENPRETTQKIKIEHDIRGTSQRRELRAARASALPILPLALRVTLTLRRAFIFDRGGRGGWGGA